MQKLFKIGFPKCETVALTFERDFKTSQDFLRLQAWFETEDGPMVYTSKIEAEPAILHLIFRGFTTKQAAEFAVLHIE